MVPLLTSGTGLDVGTVAFAAVFVPHLGRCALLSVGAFAVASILVPYLRPFALLSFTKLSHAAAGIGVLFVARRTAFSSALAIAASPVPILPRRTSLRSVSAFAATGGVSVPLSERTFAGALFSAFTLTGVSVVESHTVIFAVVASRRILAESVSKSRGGWTAIIMNHNFDGVASALEMRCGECNVVIGRVGSQPGFDHLTVEDDKGVAGRSEDEVDGFLGTVCVESYCVGCLVTFGVNLIGVSWELPARIGV